MIHQFLSNINLNIVCECIFSSKFHLLINIINSSKDVISYTFLPESAIFHNFSIGKYLKNSQKLLRIHLKLLIVPINHTYAAHVEKKMVFYITNSQ